MFFPRMNHLILFGFKMRHFCYFEKHNLIFCHSKFHQDFLVMLKIFTIIKIMLYYFWCQNSFLCPYKTQNDEWAIIQKVFEKTFDMVHPKSFKARCLSKNYSYWKINEKAYEQIICKITVWKLNTDPMVIKNRNILQPHIS